MGVLFVMPTWAAPSELWMQRMLASLGDDLAGVACYRPEGSTWRNICPTFDLIDRKQAHDRLREAIEHCQPAAILVHYLPFALRLEPALRGGAARVYVHAHGYDLTWDGRRPEPPHLPRFETEYPNRVVAMSHWATMVVASDTARRRLDAEGVPGDRIVVRPLGVPVPARPVVRDPGPPLRILYLGRLVDFKGPDLTIQAFEKACASGLDATLTLAGDGPLQAVCQEHAAQSRYADRIRMCGEVDAAEGERLRAEAHVFTAHSRLGPTTRQEETFGVSFIEAMADGLPVATGRSGSLPEIMTDGVEGVLFAQGDVDAHAKALLRLGRNPDLREHMGRAGHARALRDYAQSNAAEGLRSLLTPRD